MSTKHWFIEEVQTVCNWKRVNEVLDIKEYLTGKHNILNKPSYMYNGKEFIPRKIVLQHAKTVLNYSVGYVVSNPITLTGDKKVTDKYKRIYKRGKYNALDYDIMDKVTKYGYCFEYIYMDANREIKSKLLDPADCYPVFNHRNEYECLIEHWTTENVSYYTIYYPERVEEWTDEGGNLRLTRSSVNLSGLPILYRNQSEIGNLGRSDLLDLLPILDNMEDLLSKTIDSYYHYTSGIPVLKGQRLTGEGIPKDVISGGLNLDDGADFYFATNNINIQAFEALYKQLQSALLDIAQIPAVSMAKTDISNLSEVSIKLLFSLADMKAALNSRYLKEGIQQRFDVIRNLLELQGEGFTDDEYDTLDMVFQYARPLNEQEIVENLQMLREMNAISLETLLEHNPYVTDVSGEMDKIKGESVTGGRDIVEQLE